MSKILLASNEQSTADILSKLLKTEGYKVVIASVLSHAQELIETDDFDLTITSASKGFDPELSLMNSARTHKASMPVIVMKEAGDAEADALIDEYKPFATMGKPIKVDRLLITVQQAIDFKGDEASEDVNLNLQLEKIYQFEGIVAESPTMKSVCDMVSRVAGIDVTILLSGESGTGKTEIARTLHLNSNRNAGPFISVDCSKGDPSGELFGGGGQSALVLANEGTIFIREISKLSPATQDKLHKVLVEKSLSAIDLGNTGFDIRVIASTSDDLDKLVADGKFKEELYKILKVILIKIQPLRNRPQDIMPTFRRMLQQKLGDGETLPSMEVEVIDVLEKHSWPGNTDDIETVIDYALANLVNDSIKKESLPAGIA